MKLIIMLALAATIQAQDYPGIPGRRCDVNGVTMVPNCPPIDWQGEHPGGGNGGLDNGKRPSETPEPSAGMLLGCGIAALLVGNTLWARRR